jgi:hypothetical protein
VKWTIKENSLTITRCVIYGSEAGESNNLYNPDDSAFADTGGKSPIFSLVRKHVAAGYWRSGAYLQGRWGIL